MSNIRLLTDENVPVSITELLKANNYNVKDIKEEGLFGITDREICKLAIKEKRIIITLDKDFLNMAQLLSKRHYGVILIRSYGIRFKADLLAEFLKSPVIKNLRNKIAIVEENLVKIKK